MISTQLEGVEAKKVKEYPNSELIADFIKIQNLINEQLSSARTTPNPIIHIQEN